AAPAPARLPGAPGVPRGHPGPRAEGRGPGPPGAAAGAGAGGNRRAGSAAPRPRGSAAARAAARVGRRGTRPGAGRARRLGPEAGRGGALPGARHPLTGGRAAWRGPVKQVAAGMFLRPAVRSVAAMAQDFRLQVSPRTIWIAGLHILGVAIVWRSVYRVGAVVGLIGLALLFALALEPALRKLKSFGVPRGLGVALVVAASAAILALLLGTLIPMLVVQLQSLLTALPGLVQRLLETRWVQELAIDQQLEAQLLSELPHRVTELVKPALDVVQGAVALVGAAVVLGFLVIFMLLFGPPLYAQLIGWVPADRRDTLADGLERVLKVVSGYLGGSLLVALIGTIVIGTVLALMGVPYFVPLALSYLVLGLIPWIGSAL